MGTVAAAAAVIAVAVWAFPGDDTETVEVAEPSTSLTPTSVGPNAAAKVTLTLPSAITVGDDLVATVTYVNDTGAPIEVPNCGYTLQVTLSSEDAAHLPVRTRENCGAMPLVLPEGESSHEITISTFYSQCTTGPILDPRTTPNCDAASPPPLPPGVYDLQAVSAYGPEWVPTDLPQLVIYPAVDPSSPYYRDPFVSPEALGLPPTTAPLPPTTSPYPNAASATVDLPSTTLRQGESMTLTVTITNMGSAPMPYASCHPLATARLRNDSVEQVVFTNTIGCTDSATLAPGATANVEVEIRARYLECAQLTTGKTPECEAGTATPPVLPVGDYELVIESPILLDPQSHPTITIVE